MSKRRVYLFQPNHTFGRGAFLPYSVGLLQAYAQANPVVAAEYEFAVPGFLREPIPSVVERLKADPPSVVGISLYIWNDVYGRALGKALAEEFPDALYVLGGPHVPDRSENFFRDNPWADVLVHGEGEAAFADILVAWNMFPGEDDYQKLLSDVAGVSVKEWDLSAVKTRPRERQADLSRIPSPYLAGVFDPLMGLPFDFVASQETHRGCPFACQFCLVAGSMVATRDGEKPIEFVRAGDEVLTSNRTWKKVLRSGETKRTRDVISVLFANGSIVTGTLDHPVWTQERGWVELHLLSDEDTVMSCSETAMAWDNRAPITWLVQKVRRRFAEEVPVYDIEVERVHEFFANGILVHNCDWGSSTYTKVRRFDHDRIKAEIDWFSRYKIELLYNCDANVSMFNEDLDWCKHLVETKARTGFPKKFRGAFAKNSGERVYSFAKLLHDADMNKGVTLSFQSLDEQTLKNVKRSNIKTDNFADLIKRYKEDKIATYTELIVGLPGETYDTFADGVGKLIEAGMDEGLNVYVVELLPNSEMSAPEYRAKHGLRSVRTKMLAYHATPTDDPHPEEYELVVGTNTLSDDDWMRTMLFGCFVQAFHCMGLTRLVAKMAHRLGIRPRVFYEDLVEFAATHPRQIIGQAYLQARECYQNLRDGKDWGWIDKHFSGIVWPVEEGVVLHCVRRLRDFYCELAGVGTVYMQAVPLQQALMKAPLYGPEGVVATRGNLLEYAEGREDWNPVTFKYRIKRDRCWTDPKAWARDVVWYGRKGGSFLWDNVERFHD